MTWLTKKGTDIVIAVHVVPRASRNEISGEFNDSLKIRLKAPPVEGKANKALRKFLAEKLNIPLNAISIITGDTGRRKRIRITGIQEHIVLKTLSPDTVVSKIE